MIYLLIILAFSLFILLPVKFHFMLLKGTDDYIKLEINFFNLSKIILEIPEMKFTITNLIPILSFEYKLGSKNNSTPKAGKVVISPLRDRFKKITNVIKFILRYFNTFKKLIRILLNKVNLIYLNVEVIFGGENAALTGFLAGYIWSVIYQGLVLFSLYLSFDRANIKTSVQPNFLKHEPFQIDINCIFHLRVGYIIIASFIVTWYWLLFNMSLKTNRKAT
ncbi:MAG: DUF2953 domain-containing protein [Thermoanaerobacteraceae bacterium]|nr:DUF2953 domain-containing protein [Thermoanaerobacteraceae bacterium]